jgi:hypothetical protein
MTVNYAQAEQARNAVLKAYGIYLPEGLVAKVSAANIRDIVQILPQAQYQIHFSDVFCKFFASTNVVAFGQPVPDPHAKNAMASQGGTRKLIPQLGGNTIEEKLTALLARRNALTVCNCPAFTSPAINVLARKIYVNADLPGVTIGTLYHEFVHFLQHANLYPEFYALGARNIGVLEGITEFFTRRTDPWINAERARGQKYQSYFVDVSTRIGTGMQSRNALLRYCFQGEPYVDLGGVQPRL